MSPSSLHSTIQVLNDWEARLKPWFVEIRLLGEIPLTTAEVHEIGSLLKQVGRSRLLRPTWPHTLAVYMAAVAVRNDERSYWNVLTDGLGLSNTVNIHSRLGTSFLNILDSWKLSTFANVGGYTYVTPIRLHGGIPAYSLPDFFEDVVLPAIEKPEYVGVEITELIQLVLVRTVVHYFVDSPVRYFLNHGGEPAVDFFQRCLDMARRWNSQTIPPTAQELGLPRYVVQAFADFMQGQARTTQGKRLRPPKLQLEPASAGALFTLDLPQQPVDSDRTNWRHVWRVQPVIGNTLDSEKEITESVGVRRSGYDIVTEDSNLPLYLPPCQVRVIFDATPPEGETQQIGRWILSLAPTLELPILALRPSDGRPVRPDQAFPADILWLLYPRQTQIEISGEGSNLQSFFTLSGDWSPWQIAEWDLRKTRSLWLVDDEGIPQSAPFSIQQGQSVARLEGEIQVPGTLDPDDVPFFLGTPPTLWLPRLTGDYSEEEMARWQIKLSPRWATHSQLSAEIEAKLSDWGQYVIVHRDEFELPLSAILGAVDVMGVFGLEIRGPRTFRQELRFRIWSDLVISDLQECYLPGPQGAEPVQFYVAVATDQQVAAPAGEEAPQVFPTDQPGQYRVMVAPHRLEAVLDLVAPRPQDESVRVSLRLAIPRLRWMVRLNGKEADWQTTAPTLPVDTVRQSQNRGLLLDWGRIDKPPYATIVLKDATGVESRMLQEVDLDPRKLGRRPYLDLTEFFDTIQQNRDCPIFTLSMRAFVGGALSDMPLLHLSQSLDIQAVVMEWDAQGQMHLHWDAPHRLRNRRVRLWSAWQRWIEGREFLIPDDVTTSPLADGEGGGMITLGMDLLPGWYQVAFRTAHSWEDLYAPATPTPDKLCSKEAEPGRRLDALAAQLQNEPARAFEIRFEQACIYHSTGDADARNLEIQWLCANVGRGDPIQVIALERWLQSFDPNSARAVRMRMFRIEQVGRLFNESVPERVRGAYLDCFVSAKTVSGEIAALMLAQTQRPDVVNRALEILLKSNMDESWPKLAAGYILEQMSEGAYRDRDAEDLLSADPDKSLAWLMALPHSPARHRLLRALSKKSKTMAVVQVGTWVRCEAGWGRIERIQQDRQDRADWVLGDSDVLLHVLLRPGPKQERVEIDTGNRQIRFLDAREVFRCAKQGCRGFVSANQSCIVADHNHAAHQGIGPSFGPRDLTWQYRRPLEFTVNQPDNLFS